MSAAPPFRQVTGTLVPGGDVQSVTGVRVGSAERTDSGWLTGTTVIAAPPGAVAGADVRGGGPATHETDVIAPGTHSPAVDALVLTGGSAWGLASAGGVQRGLAEDGRGFPAPGLPGAFVPIVPAAAVYDLGRGDGTVRHPDAELGYEAYRSAAELAPLRRGSVGAGTGGFIGRGLLRGGLGSACLRTAAGHLVAAIVAANPMGDVLEPAGRLHAAGVLARLGAELPPAPADWVERALAVSDAARSDPSLRNTTIAAVVTDAPLDSARATRLAQSAQAGLARAIHPSHTLADGDTVFSLATGTAGTAGTDPGSPAAPLDPLTLLMLNAAAADALSLAIVDAALSAAPHEEAAPGGAPRPAALSQLAPELAEAWRRLRTAGT
ncbi:P1 family peptidase [Brevibacterium album]|uniref:P1 family peptidase n=1 Tax=Brevibacterium album TaxID=417948 RepID=UPI0003F637EB|nr:P1 family peptidase [Brevibacterium album]